MLYIAYIVVHHVVYVNSLVVMTPQTAKDDLVLTPFRVPKKIKLFLCKRKE